MAWHVIHRIEYTNAKNNPCKIELEEDRDSAPSSVGLLPVLINSRTINWEFSNKFGEGILARRFKLTLKNNAPTDFVDLFQSKGYRKLRLVVTVDGKILFKGFADSETISTPLVNRDKQTTFFGNWTNKLRHNLTLIFSDSVAGHKNATIGRLRNAIQASTNSFHAIENVPLSDLISQFIFEELCTETDRLVTAHHNEMRYGTGAFTTEATFYWLRRLTLDLSIYDRNKKVSELLRGIAELFNVRIGYSYTYDAIAVFDYLTLANGENPNFDEDQNEYDIKPHFLDKNTGNGLRTVDDTTIVAQSINFTADKITLEGDIKQYPRQIASIVNYLTPSATGLVFNNDEQAQLNFIQETKNTGIDYSTMRVYANDNSLISAFQAAPVFRPNWYTDGNNPTFFYPLDFITAKSQAYHKFRDRIAVKIGVKKLLDPMLAVLLSVPFVPQNRVYNMVKGSWDILTENTVAEMVQIGEQSPAQVITPVGVSFPNWIFNDL